MLERLRDSRQPILWAAAHRGDRSKGSDNGSTAIRAAVDASIPLIEIDVRSNAEGTLILFHDKKLTGKNFSGPFHLRGRSVETLTDEEIAGMAHPPPFGEKILTLDEALDLVDGQRSALQLDIKGGQEPRVAALAVELASRKGAIDRIVVQCQRLETLSMLRERYPDVAVLARLQEWSEMAVAAPLSPEIVQVSSDYVSPLISRRIRAAGARTLVKSLGERDGPAFWDELISKGVEIILTDRTTELSRHLARLRDRNELFRTGPVK